MAKRSSAGSRSKLLPDGGGGGGGGGGGAPPVRDMPGLCVGKTSAAVLLSSVVVCFWQWFDGHGSYPAVDESRQKPSSDCDYAYIGSGRSQGARKNVEDEWVENDINVDCRRLFHQCAVCRIEGGRGLYAEKQRGRPSWKLHRG